MDHSFPSHLVCAAVSALDGGLGAGLSALGASSALPDLHGGSGNTARTTEDYDSNLFGYSVPLPATDGNFSTKLPKSEFSICRLYPTRSSVFSAVSNRHILPS